MTRWSKVRAVASFEFLSSVKRPGYLIATFGMPVFMLLYGGVISSIGVFIGNKTSEVRIYGVVDHAAMLHLEQDVSRSAIELPENIRAALELAGDRSAIGSSFAFWSNFVFRPFEELEAAKASLLAGDIKGIYVIPKDYVETGRIESYAREGPDLEGSESRGALKNLLLDRLVEGKVAEEVVERVRRPIAERKEWTLTDAGEVIERSMASVVAKLLVPILFAVLLFISLMMSAGYLLQGTAIEKENKLVEVLLSSANPDEILAGKLIGLCGAGLFQVMVWFGMVVASGVLLGGVFELSGFDFPWGGMVTGIFFFLAAYLFLGSLMLGTGSLGSTMKESQQLSMIWTLPTVVPLVFMQILIIDPHSTFARVLTWIPFTAPVTVVLRTSLDPEGIHWWEIAGSFAVMVLATWMAIHVGARLFRVGLLLSGSRPSWRAILRQARLSS